MARPGRPRSAPYVNRNVTLPPDLDTWLKEKAKAEDRSISSFTRWVLSKERERQRAAEAEDEKLEAATA